jgi:hypothetical protein
VAFSGNPVVVAGNNRADQYVHVTVHTITPTTCILKFLSSTGPAGGPGFYAHYIAIGNIA